MDAVCSWQSTVKLIKKQTNKNSYKYTADYCSIVTRKCDFVKTRPEQKGQSDWQKGTVLQTKCNRTRSALHSYLHLEARWGYFGQAISRSASTATPQIANAATRCTDTYSDVLTFKTPRGFMEHATEKSSVFPIPIFTKLTSFPQHCMHTSYK
jgi:hypothetical protein